jgi:hypothetical protein
MKKDVQDYMHRNFFEENGRYYLSATSDLLDEKMYNALNDRLGRHVPSGYMSDLSVWELEVEDISPEMLEND